MAKTVIHQFIPEYKQFRPWNQTTSDEATKRCVHTVGYGRVSLDLPVAVGRPRTELSGARRLKPYPGKPDVRNFRGAVGNVVHGGTAHPPAIERAGSDKLSPNDARASGLPNAVHFARNIAVDQTEENLIDGLSAFHTRPSRDGFVARSEIPIHVVTGDRDTPPGLVYSRELAASAKHGKLHVVKSCGHYVPMVQAETLNALLEEIIKPLCTADKRG